MLPIPAYVTAAIMRDFEHATAPPPETWSTRRLFFLRQNPLPTVPFYSHLVFRGVEFKNDAGSCAIIDLEFILGRRFERDGGLRPGRLRVKRGAFSGDRKFQGSVGGRINSDVFVQLSMSKTTS